MSVGCKLIPVMLRIRFRRVQISRVSVLLHISNYTAPLYRMAVIGATSSSTCAIKFLSDS